MAWPEEAREFQASLDRLLSERHKEVAVIEGKLESLLQEIYRMRDMTAAMETAARVIRSLRTKKDAEL